MTFRFCFCIIAMFARDAGIAQLVEQLICNQQVGGSSPSTSSINKRRQPRGWNGSDTISYGGIPEWPKGADCKSVVTDFGGSNPPSPTRKKRRPLDVSFSCVWAFGRWIRKAALGDSPVDCRNRRGFSAEKRIHRRMRSKETAFRRFLLLIWIFGGRLRVKRRLSLRIFPIYFPGGFLQRAATL